MRAMVLNRILNLETDRDPLEMVEFPLPAAESNEVVIRVSACGICHTELDEIEGRTPPLFVPIVPGHQVVGRVAGLGSEVSRWKEGDRVGVAWIYSSCGDCSFCREGRENLCELFRATGRDAHGGYAEYMKVREDFVYRIPDLFGDAEAAPLLCAGAIGYRSLQLAGLKDSQYLGLTGFGASAHLVLKMAKHLYPSCRIHVFARSETERSFAAELGADSTGDTTDSPPHKLHAIIDTTPVWKPVLEGLKNLERGGRLVINAIRKESSDIETLLRLNYAAHLWMEKEIKTVANVTRQDVQQFLNLAASLAIRPEYESYPLEDANRALLELKTRKIRGAKVIVL